MAKKTVAFGLPARNPKICTVEGCDKALRARGYCAAHWWRWRNHGEPGGPITLPTPQMCSVRGCYNGNAVHYKGGPLLCNKHYLRMLNKGTVENTKRDLRDFDRCSAEGCDRSARSRHGEWCEMHYGRLRRNGTLEKKIKDRAETGYTPEGYVWVLDPSHPLAIQGRVTLHRKVLYDEIGPGPHRCRWCGMTVRWGGKHYGSLVVDHVDGDKEHNESENLVPACTSCNTTRGSFMKWASKHADDPFLKLLFGYALDDGGYVQSQFLCEAV